jgi:hypothetical protein
MPTADIFTGIVAGFTNQQVFNDPNGDRWLRQTRRVVEMFLAGIEAGPSKSQTVTPTKKNRKKER